MVVEEPDRSALLRAVAQTLGQEAADTLSELLPPSGDRPATKRDIDGVLTAMNARFEGVNAQFDAVNAQFRSIDQQFDAMNAQFRTMNMRFDTMDEQFKALSAQVGGYGISLDDKLDNVVDRVTASFERRISDAVTTQTRTLVFSQLGALVVIAALAFGLR
ncbi:MAG: hypothetical protein EA388_11105 [Nitriliruptor sp.]|nr:MAG: hypothetical protein EA388_11105 [Nitriliruptor sp.]